MSEVTEGGGLFLDFGILLTVIAIAYFLFLFAYAIYRYIGILRNNKAMDEQMEEEVDEDPIPISIGARVMDKSIRKAYMGRGRGYEYRFSVTFLTDDEIDVAYTVSQEVFDRISIDQTGTLVTVNGSFFDFGDGEPVQ